MKCRNSWNAGDAPSTSLVRQHNWHCASINWNGASRGRNPWCASTVRSAIRTSTKRSYCCAMDAITVRTPTVSFHRCRRSHPTIGKIESATIAQTFASMISTRYCHVCIGKAKGESLCFVCGRKDDNECNRCEHCAKLFHSDCLENARYQQGTWLCVQCAANYATPAATASNGTSTNGKSVSVERVESTETMFFSQQGGRQTSRSLNSRRPSLSSTTSTTTNTNGECVSPVVSSKNRYRPSSNRKSESSDYETATLQESQTNTRQADSLPVRSRHDSSPAGTDEDASSPATNGTSNDARPRSQKKKQKKPARKANVSNDIKACR